MTGEETSQRTPRRAWRPWLLASAGAIVVLLCGWFVEGRAAQKSHAELAREADSAREGILLRLRSDEDFLVFLSGRIASQDLDRGSFEAAATRYVKDHPELINIIWSDRDFVIRWAALDEANQELVGLTLSLPEPERVSHLARDTRRPAYTRPFVVIQGKPAFEIYVPVFRDGVFQGVVGGVYAVESLLLTGIPETTRERFSVGLVAQSGRAILDLSGADTADASRARTAPLDPPGYGVSLRLAPRHRGPSWIAMALGLALAGALAYWTLWSRRRSNSVDIDDAAPTGDPHANPSDWALPAAVSGALIATLAVLLWSVRQRSRTEEIVNLERAAQVAIESFELRFAGTQDFLQMLAQRRAARELDLRTFQEIGARYVEAHAELVNFTWVDEHLTIQSASPLEPNQQIVGLHVDLPEPARAAELARRTRQPASTRPFEAIQGKPSFEVWVPVFRGEEFLGLFVGVFSAERFLEHVTPREVSVENQVQLLDENGSALATLASAGKPDPELRLEKELTAPAHGARLVLTRYGDPFWNWGILGSAVTAVSLALGMLVSMTSLRREIRRRTEAQRLLHETNRNLEATVAERTSELRQRNLQLDEARRDAESANRAKGAFLAQMSHEIRTPMNAVIGLSGLLGETELSDEQRDFAGTIRASGEHLLAVINDILDFSKLESGKFPIERLPCSLAELVQEALRVIAFKTRESGVEVRAETTGEVPRTVLIDPVRVRQILLNYLSNAAKFTSSGSIVVRTSASPAGPASVLVHISVEDSGMGIPADRMASLFGAFSQVDDSTARRFGGTGLGLAISKRLAELMGGRAWAESELGRGSTFHVTFVAGVSDASASVTPDAAVGAKAKKPAPARPLRILVAEDNVVNQKVITALLRRLGYEPDLASNGKQALEAARRKVYDVILMDVQMPEMDGLEATRLLREDHGAGSRPRIVALTAGVMPEERQRCMEAGMDGFLHKPVVRDDLVAALDLRDLRDLPSARDEPTGS